MTRSDAERRSDWMKVNGRDCFPISNCASHRGLFSLHDLYAEDLGSTHRTPWDLSHISKPSTWTLFNEPNAELCFRVDGWTLCRHNLS